MSASLKGLYKVVMSAKPFILGGLASLTAEFGESQHALDELTRLVNKRPMAWLRLRLPRRSTGGGLTELVLVLV